ncbi:hypothetical protein C6P21_11050 [Weissella confusa]|uniref:hypothetical protein n=1 Tax=Weissella confusa TaxID=1583 RepID=UPI001081A4F3|nr:hypothetical protein [Weissella confusa]TGE55911.1 hypothetical protein C6P21_11050 [Weissella confusa]
MSDNKKHNNQGPLIFIGIAIGIVAILLGVLVYQNHESSPEVQSQKSSISSSNKNASEQSSLKQEMSDTVKKFKSAPKGNYIIINNGIFETSWSKEQLKQFLDSTANKIQNDAAQPSYETDFGTKSFSISTTKDLYFANSTVLDLQGQNIDDIYFDSAYKAFEKNPVAGTTLDD